MKTGVVLALHDGRAKGDFVVLARITGLHDAYGNILDPDKIIKEYSKSGAYTSIWFQETKVPKQ